MIKKLSIVTGRDGQVSEDRKLSFVKLLLVHVPSVVVGSLEVSQSLSDRRL